MDESSEKVAHIQSILFIDTIGVQSYKKSRAKQKNLFFFLPRRSKFANLLAKLRKVEHKTKTLFVILCFTFFFVPLHRQNDFFCI